MLHFWFFERDMIYHNETKKTIIEWRDKYYDYGGVPTAIILSKTAHLNQYDKGGFCYFYHPCRVASKFEDPTLITIALLHDVVEDTDVTFEDLKKYCFDIDVIESIKCLTHIEGEPYQEYIERISKNPLATKVKIEDLKDNMDTKRLYKLTDTDKTRIEKYKKALNFLTGEL